MSSTEIHANWINQKGNEEGGEGKARLVHRKCLKPKFENGLENWHPHFCHPFFKWPRPKYYIKKRGLDVGGSKIMYKGMKKPFALIIHTCIQGSAKTKFLLNISFDLVKNKKTCLADCLLLRFALQVYEFIDENRGRIYLLPRTFNISLTW